MGNKGLVRGLRQSDLLPRSWIGDINAPNPITSNIMNVGYMSGVQTNPCALVPDAIPTANMQDNLGLGLDNSGWGHTYDSYNPGTPGVAGSPTYIVGGNTFGASVPNPTTGSLWNNPKTGLPVVADPTYPGGARLGGNMNMTGHIISLGGLYMTGTFTLNSPPVDPQNQFYDIWVNRTYTLTGSPGVSGAGAAGRPNYFSAAFTPTVIATTNNDTADLFGAVLAAPSVTASHVAVCGPIATQSILYAKTVGAATGSNGSWDGGFNSPPTAHFAQVTPTGGAWFGLSGSSVFASWSDISPAGSVTISNGIIHNQTVGYAGQVLTVTGHLIGTAFSPNIPGANTPFFGNIAGVNSSVTVSGQIWGAVLGYPNQFQVANLFGTHSTTAPVYAVDIQGTGPLGAIGLPGLTTQGTRASSNNGAIYLYKGASSGNWFLIIEMNKAGTTSYTAIKTDTNGTVTVSNAATLPT